MRVFFAIVIALAAMLPGAGRASDYLYTFAGVVSGTHIDYDDDNLDGDPFAFSLRVRDSFHHVSYVYSPSGSSAIGDSGLGMPFPVDRRAYYDPSLGYLNIDDYTPLETGFERCCSNYSASVSKDAATNTLKIDTDVEYQAPYPPCQDYCNYFVEDYFTDVDLSSAAFTSPDFREVGSFDLAPGSTATIGDEYASHDEESFYFVDIALSHLTVERLPDAVPEPDAWSMMIGGLGFTGAAMRRRSNVRASVALA